MRHLVVLLALFLASCDIVIDPEPYDKNADLFCEFDGIPVCSGSIQIAGECAGSSKISGTFKLRQLYESGRVLECSVTIQEQGDE